MIYHFDTVGSTNDVARDTQYRDGDIVWADFQTAGRGQRGHTWESRAGENLTFSVVLEPHFLPIAEQFMLLEAVALALSDFFAEVGVGTKIKWTNDIYVGNRKAVGILIEHNYSGGKLSRTIVGIGINVNQTEFSADIPNPISLSLLTGEKYDRKALLEQFEKCLTVRYSQLKNGEWGKLQSDYTVPGARQPWLVMIFASSSTWLSGCWFGFLGFGRISSTGRISSNAQKTGMLPAMPLILFSFMCHLVLIPLVFIRPGSFSKRNAPIFCP